MFTEGESDEPLFRVTITRFTKLNCTSIGTSVSHVLCTLSLDLPNSSRCADGMTSGDGTGFLLFFRHLSQLYQGLEPIDPPPYHEPEAIKFAEPLNAPSPPCDHSDPSATPPWMRGEMKPIEFVAFRLTAAQLTEIHNSVTKGFEGPRIARADTVLVLLARCLSEVESESKPIDTITYTINVSVFVTPRATRLIPPSTAEWVYTRPTQCLTLSLVSP